VAAEVGREARSIREGIEARKNAVLKGITVVYELITHRYVS
jgi:hypothetical protein